MLGGAGLRRLARYLGSSLKCCGSSKEKRKGSSKKREAGKYTKQRRKSRERERENETVIKVYKQSVVNRESVGS